MSSILTYRGDGVLQVLNTTEKANIAQIVLEYMAYNDGPGSIYTADSGGNSLIGLFTDTSYQGNVGEGDVTIISNQYNLYQDLQAPTGPEPDRPLVYTNSSKPIQIMSENQIEALAADILDICVLQEGPNSYVLDSSAPSDGGTWTNIGQFTDQYTGDTSTNKFLFKKLSSGSFTISRPVKYVSAGTLKIFTDNDLHNISKKVRERIVNTGIGQYRLQVSAPSTGTWVAKGTVTNTIASEVTNDYTTSYVEQPEYTKINTVGFTNAAVEYYVGVTPVDFTSIAEETYDNIVIEFYNSTDEEVYTGTNLYTGTVTTNYSGPPLVDYTTDIPYTLVTLINYTSPSPVDYTGIKPEDYSGIGNVIYTGVGFNSYGNDIYTGAYILNDEVYTFFPAYNPEITENYYTGPASVTYTGLDSVNYTTLVIYQGFRQEYYDGGVPLTSYVRAFSGSNTQYTNEAGVFVGLITPYEGPGTFYTLMAFAGFERDYLSSYYTGLSYTTGRYTGGQEVNIQFETFLFLPTLYSVGFTSYQVEFGSSAYTANYLNAVLGANSYEIQTGPGVITSYAEYDGPGETGGTIIIYTQEQGFDGAVFSSINYSTLGSTFGTPSFAGPDINFYTSATVGTVPAYTVDNIFYTTAYHDMTYEGPDQSDIAYTKNDAITYVLSEYYTGTIVFERLRYYVNDLFYTKTVQTIQVGYYTQEAPFYDIFTKLETYTGVTYLSPGPSSQNYGGFFTTIVGGYTSSTSLFAGGTIYNGPSGNFAGPPLIDYTGNLSYIGESVSRVYYTDASSVEYSSGDAYIRQNVYQITVYGGVELYTYGPETGDSQQDGDLSSERNQLVYAFGPVFYASFADYYNQIEVYTLFDLRFGGFYTGGDDIIYASEGSTNTIYMASGYVDYISAIYSAYTLLTDYLEQGIYTGPPVDIVAADAFNRAAYYTGGDVRYSELYNSTTAPNFFTSFYDGMFYTNESYTSQYASTKFFTGYFSAYSSQNLGMEYYIGPAIYERVEIYSLEEPIYTGLYNKYYIADETAGTYLSEYSSATPDSIYALNELTVYSSGLFYTTTYLNETIGTTYDSFDATPAITYAGFIGYTLSFAGNTGAYDGPAALYTTGLAYYTLVSYTGPAFIPAGSGPTAYYDNLITNYNTFYTGTANYLSPAGTYTNDLLFYETSYVLVPGQVYGGYDVSNQAYTTDVVYDSAVYSLSIYYTLARNEFLGSLIVPGAYYDTYISASIGVEYTNVIDYNIVYEGTISEKYQGLLPDYQAEGFFSGPSTSYASYLGEIYTGGPVYYGISPSMFASNMPYTLEYRNYEGSYAGVDVVYTAIFMAYNDGLYVGAVTYFGGPITANYSSIVPNFGAYITAGNNVQFFEQGYTRESFATFTNDYTLTFAAFYTNAIINITYTGEIDYINYFTGPSAVVTYQGRAFLDRAYIGIGDVIYTGFSPETYTGTIEDLYEGSLTTVYDQTSIYQSLLLTNPDGVTYTLQEEVNYANFSDYTGSYSRYFNGIVPISYTGSYTGNFTGSVFNLYTLNTVYSGPQTFVQFASIYTNNVPYTGNMYDTIISYSGFLGFIRFGAIDFETNYYTGLGRYLELYQGTGFYAKYYDSDVTEENYISDTVTYTGNPYYESLALFSVILEYTGPESTFLNPSQLVDYTFPATDYTNENSVGYATNDYTGEFASTYTSENQYDSSYTSAVITDVPQTISSLTLWRRVA